MTFTWPADLPQKALWGTLPGQVASKTVHLAGKKSKNCLWDTCSGGTSGQVNVTRAGFAVSYFVSHTCWQPLPQRVNSVNANDSTAAGIKRLRRLKFKRCGELASRLSSRLTFACVCLVVRANHLTVNMPLRIRVGVHRVFPQTAKPPVFT